MGYPAVLARFTASKIIFPWGEALTSTARGGTPYSLKTESLSQRVGKIDKVHHPFVLVHFRIVQKRRGNQWIKLLSLQHSYSISFLNFLFIFQDAKSNISKFSKSESTVIKIQQIHVYFCLNTWILKRSNFQYFRLTDDPICPFNVSQTQMRIKLLADSFFKMKEIAVQKMWKVNHPHQITSHMYCIPMLGNLCSRNIIA